MGSYTGKIAWETLRSIDSATLSGTYVALGAPLKFASYIAKLVNTSNIMVTISIDGINDMDIAPANSFWLYDEGKGQHAYEVLLPQGTQIMVKATAGAAGVGLVYFVTQYIVQL